MTTVWLQWLQWLQASGASGCVNWSNWWFLDFSISHLSEDWTSCIIQVILGGGAKGDDPTEWTAKQTYFFWFLGASLGVPDKPNNFVYNFIIFFEASILCQGQGAAFDGWGLPQKWHLRNYTLWYVNVFRGSKSSHVSTDPNSRVTFFLPSYLPRPCGFCKFLGGLVLYAKWISMSQVTQPLGCQIHRPYPGLTGQAPRDGFQVTKCESNASGHTLSGTERGTNWCVFQRREAVVCVVTWRVHSVAAVATQNEDEIRTVRRLGCICKNVTRNRKNNYSVWWLMVTQNNMSLSISIHFFEGNRTCNDIVFSKRTTPYHHIFKY